MNSIIRRGFIIAAVCGAIAVGWYPSFCLGQEAVRRKPNVVILFIDDAFVATLPPLKPSADYKGGGQVPKGWGWEIGDGT